MFLDHILRPSEVKEFEATLQPHQLAKIAQSSSDRLASTRNDDQSAQEPGASTRVGPSTVLDRAVLEHNVLSCSKIYSNISFSGLGALLDLTPGAAETMARKMIEQGRLRGWIDQVDKLIWFEGKVEDDDAQGKAGGLGDVSQEVEETGAPFTKGWDRQIRLTAGNVSHTMRPIRPCPQRETGRDRCPTHSGRRFSETDSPTIMTFAVLNLFVCHIDMIMTHVLRRPSHSSLCSLSKV